MVIMPLFSLELVSVWCNSLSQGTSSSNAFYHYKNPPMPTWPPLRDDSGITRVLFVATRGLLAHHLGTLVTLAMLVHLRLRNMCMTPNQV